MPTPYSPRAVMARLRALIARIFRRRREDPDVPAALGVVYGPPVVLRNLPGDHVWARPAAPQDPPPPILLAHRSAAAMDPQPRSHWTRASSWDPSSFAVPAVMIAHDDVDEARAVEVGGIVGADTGAAVGGDWARDATPSDVQDDRRDDAGTNAGGEA